MKLKQISCKKNISDNFRDVSLENVVIFLLLFSAFVLSSIQLLADRSLWIDEVMIALNIIEKSYLELLLPLDYKQVSPIGFLWIEKFFSYLWPNTDYGLRIWPLINYWAATLLFWQIGRQLFKNPYAQILSLSLWVFNCHLLYYSSEVKQYMGDVAICMGLLWLLLNKNLLGKYYFGALIAGGILAILFSNIAIILLASAGIYLIVSVHWSTNLKYLFVTGVVWIATFIVYYFLFIQEHPTRDFMILFWKKENAFWTGLPWQKQFYDELFHKLSGALLLLNIGFKKSIAVGGLCAIAMLFGARRNVLVLFLPIAIHLVISYFQLYPFHTRLILYTLPLLILMAGMGFQHILDLTFSDLGISRLRILGIIIPFLLTYIFNWNSFPLQNEEIKSTISYIEQKKNSDEKVYAYFTASLALKYYELQGKFIKGSSWIIGNGNWSDRTSCIDEILALKGKYWILFYHTRTKDKEFLLEQINKAGIVILDKMEATGSSAYLFDFL